MRARFRKSDCCCVARAVRQGYLNRGDTGCLGGLAGYTRQSHFWRAGFIVDYLDVGQQDRSIPGWTQRLDHRFLGGDPGSEVPLGIRLTGAVLNLPFREPPSEEYLAMTIDQAGDAVHRHYVRADPRIHSAPHSLVDYGHQGFSSDHGAFGIEVTRIRRVLVVQREVWLSVDFSRKPPPVRSCGFGSRNIEDRF